MTYQEAIEEMRRVREWDERQDEIQAAKNELKERLLGRRIVAVRHATDLCFVVLLDDGTEIQFSAGDVGTSEWEGLFQ